MFRFVYPVRGQWHDTVELYDVYCCVLSSCSKINGDELNVPSTNQWHPDSARRLILYFVAKIRIRFGSLTPVSCSKKVVLVYVSGRINSFNDIGVEGGALTAFRARCTTFFIAGMLGKAALTAIEFDTAVSAIR